MALTTQVPPAFDALSFSMENPILLPPAPVLKGMPHVDDVPESTDQKTRVEDDAVSTPARGDVESIVAASDLPDENDDDDLFGDRDGDLGDWPTDMIGDEFVDGAASDAAPLTSFVQKKQPRKKNDGVDPWLCFVCEVAPRAISQRVYGLFGCAESYVQTRKEAGT